VHVRIGRHNSHGITHYGRRSIAARFLDRVHPELRAELTELACRRGAAARRAADRMQPIVVVIDDPCLGRERIVGRIEPPQVRRGLLGEVEFGLRERTR
jgi:hypothetical protein